MKKLIFTLALALVATVQTMAMSRSRSMEEAAFLTDKMIYELGLSPMQTEDVYQINYDYFTQVGYTASLNARAAEIRMRQLEFVLTPNQFRMCQSIIYFLTPAMLHNGQFYFRIYTHYEPGIFYFDRPSIYRDYRGGYLNNINHYQGRRPTGYFFHNGVMSTEPRPMHPGPGPRNGQPGNMVPGNGYRQPNTANPNNGQRTGGVTSTRGNNQPANNAGVSRSTGNNNQPANNGNVGAQRRFGQANNGGAANTATPARQTNTGATTTRGNGGSTTTTRTPVTNNNTTGTNVNNSAGGSNSQFSGGSTGRRGR